MNDLNLPELPPFSPQSARLMGATTSGNEMGSLEKLCEQIREAVGADLACLLESPDQNSCEPEVDVKFAAGTAASEVAGLHSKLSSVETSPQIPSGLVEFGFTQGRVLPINGRFQNARDWLGVFWSEPAKLADDVEEFLGTAAELISREMIRASVEKQVQSEKLYRTIGDTIPFGVWVADALGRPSYVSESFLKLIGTDLEGFISMNWIERIHVDDRETINASFIEAVTQGLPWSAEMRILGTDGREYTVLSKGAPFFDENQNRIGYAGFQLDITDRRFAENELKRSEEQYRQIVDIATEGIWKTDSIKRTMFTNRSLTDLLGYSSAEFSDLIIEDLIAPECLPAFHSGWNAARAGLRNQFDCSFKCKNGENVWALVSLSPMFDRNDRFSGALVLLTDVTERHEAENKLKKAKRDSDEANQAKSKFLANMSHEIRTPLSSVLGFAELLLDEDQTEAERRESVHAIRRNGHLLLNLINDILDLSKVEAGRMDIEPVIFQLPDLVAEIRSIFKPQATNKRLEFDVIGDESLPNEICTDPTRLRQILFNLIGNAIKFTDAGKVAVHLSRQKHDLVVEIEDSGPGIAKEDAQRLFSPFTQADASITRRFGGTGLGLVLSRNLARALGGDVRLVRSILGEGSVFEVRVILDLLPGDSSCESARKPRAQKTKDYRYLENLNVLLVDDSPDNRLLVRRMLEPFGVKLTLAENGLRGFELAMESEYDLVFMDMQMPVLDGYQATERLRKSGFAKPIVALTAQAMKEERRRALKVGCTHHLAKPLTKQGLLDTIAECLRK